MSRADGAALPSAEAPAEGANLGNPSQVGPANAIDYASRFGRRDLGVGAAANVNAHVNLPPSLAPPSDLLSALAISAGVLSPPFSSGTPSYTAQVSASLGVTGFTVTPTAVDARATITVGGVVVTSGTASRPLALSAASPSATTPIDVSVTAPGGRTAHYTLVITNVPDYVYLKASNTRARSSFGYAVALSGDTLAVGAYQESSAARGVGGNQADTGAPNAGAVYVYARHRGAWAQEAYIKASNASGDSYFGYSLSLSGDTLAVGAYQEPSATRGIDGDQSDTSAPNAGAVYVYTRNGGAWSQQSYLKASNTSADSYFGQSVSLCGDTLAVGAYSEPSAATGVNGDQGDTSAPGAGAVYVYTRNASVWSQQAYIKASNTKAYSYFAHAVSLDGDTLAVGSYAESSLATGIDGNQGDTSAPYAGAVYVFRRDSGIWVQRSYIKASNTRGTSYFGHAVSLSGDTLAVGAYGEPSAAAGINGDQTDASAAYAGAVYLFSSTNGGWAQQSYIKASNARTLSGFGHSVAVSGDALAVGAYGESSGATGVNGNANDTGTTYAGAAYMYTRNNAVWSERSYVKAAVARADNGFGFSVALSGDTLAVGTPWEPSAAIGLDGNTTDTSAPTAGAVYIIR
ncbi:MAG: integrin [Myxococcota bacterium]|nr:integrin [Myxococcota bacterium]